MNLKELNRLFILIAALVLIAAMILVLGWNYFFSSEEGNEPQGEEQKYARIIHRTGSVLAKKADSVEWRSVGEGDYLGERDKLKTQRDSTATVEFENGSLLNLKPNSLIIIERLFSNNTKVELVGGKLNAQIEKIGRDEMFLIKAKSAQAEVFREEIRVD